MSLSTALHARMVADGQLGELLAIYAGQPAVFTVDPPPDDAELPYVITPGELATNPFDTKDLRGRELYQDIRCYTARTGSSKAVGDIADRVRVLFHRRPIVVDGQPSLLTSVTGPRNAGGDDSYGRLLTVRVVLDPA
ncbi:DUF3168 domain-containing protein [Blastococcus sp. CT_GayMR16]|uniref:tail completion protein gp17 n=1 Tax=Blastococcus sp. CT_GayMR16 TaxID=2559607 RepID=UPI00107327DC|nr:DUF3168 domain-containing protein [Blastococcus sp. CT_GayMR16]TFV83159.1 DUF3168 domain-containing protein [Blastococcus sp. CT_GayMR16]